MGGGGGHPAPPHPFILQNCVIIQFPGTFKIDRTQYRLQPGRQSGLQNYKHSSCIYGYPAMANKSERQLHESVQKALMKHFPHVKGTRAQ